MTNFQKRILTSLIILPLSIFFVIKGGNILLIFLLAIFFMGNYELFSVFNKKVTILFLNLILILSLFSIYYLSNENETSFKLLLWVIILCVLSDIGGYVFGKAFKWKKFTSLSPKKTLSGVIGSFIFSLLSLPIVDSVMFTSSDDIQYLETKFFFLAIILSLVAQMGDLTISYFKRLEKIKDTGKILPGHGGIFDRIDGLIFVVILTFISYKFNIIP